MHEQRQPNRKAREVSRAMRRRLEEREQDNLPSGRRCALIELFAREGKDSPSRKGGELNLRLAVEFPSDRRAGPPRREVSSFPRGVLLLVVGMGAPPCERSEPGGESFLEGRPRPRG